MDAQRTSSYDDVPYLSWPFSQSHPDRLATVATVFGMDPPPATGDEFRMLELGCACGDNLIPLAMQHPRAQFFGIDLSQRQIEQGRQAASRLGVTNVRLERMDILDFPESGEPFDYIAAHGVYSWVPAEVRDAMLAICRQHLKPNGIAYISYNVFPGWQMKGIVRDVLMYHVRHLSDPEERIQQALAFLQFMAHRVPHDNPAYTELYRNVLKSLGDEGGQRTRLFHDLLEPVNDPVYFCEFVAHAARNDLQYLAEADVQEMQTMRFPPAIESLLGTLGDDVIQREQYLDFFKHRPFRQTLLCHRNVSLDRQLRPERLARLYVAADITCDTPEGNLRSTEPFRFRGARDVEASVDHPLTKAALLHLADSWPGSLAYAELEVAARRRVSSRAIAVQRAEEYARDQRELAEHLLQLYAAGLVELHVYQPKFTTQLSERPVASPWARMQAERSNKVTNVCHTGVQLSDVNRQLLLLLDGTRDRSQLLDDLARHVEDQKLIVVHEGKAVQGSDGIRPVLNQMLDEALQTAASLALLIA